MRAAHLAARYGLSAEEVEQQLADRDSALRRYARNPLTLWFEADLYDQLQLIQVLSRLRDLTSKPQLQLISIGEHPDRAHFGGLGELTGPQLDGLLPMARSVSAAGLALAAKAWSAFTASDPTDLGNMRGVISSDLRYLGDAVSRLLQEYPSRSDGLSITQRRILLAVGAGHNTLDQILRSHWETEPRPFLGDLGCLSEVRMLSEAPTPSLEQSNGRYALTEFGRRLLAGGADWIEARGIDRWIGGVHLTARDVRWRYDERLERLISP
jgi:hypothetical protein